MDWKKEQTGEFESSFFEEKKLEDEILEGKRLSRPSLRERLKNKLFRPFQRRGDHGLIYGTLVLSLLALLLSGISLYRLQKTPRILEQVTSRQDEVSSRVDVLQSQVSRMEARISQEELVGLIADLQQTLIRLKSLSDTSLVGTKAQVDTVTRDVEDLLKVLRERVQPRPDNLGKERL